MRQSVPWTERAEAGWRVPGGVSLVQSMLRWPSELLQIHSISHAYTRHLTLLYLDFWAKLSEQNQLVVEPAS